MGLIEVISKEVAISQQQAVYIQSLFQRRHYKRGAVLLPSGQVANELFFVVEGALRQFYVNEAGDERTCNFTFENEFVTDLESFSQQTTSPSSIKALINTTCLCIRCEDLKILLKDAPEIAEFFRIFVERIAAKSMRRTKSLLYASPEKHFLELIEEQPWIFQRVPQLYIAQYLGIAPESLSRIKKRLMANVKS